MPQSDPGSPHLPEDRAPILFAQLDVAQALGDYAHAADVQRQLAEIGWIVSRRRPRPARREKAAPTSTP